MNKYRIMDNGTPEATVYSTLSEAEDAYDELYSELIRGGMSNYFDCACEICMPTNLYIEKF